MQIKIEIEMKPEELRRFLGLPDVAGLQDDVLQFVRDKVGQVNENFNPADFLRDNLDVLRQSPAWQKLKARLLVGGEEKDPAAESPPADKSGRRRRGGARKGGKGGKDA